VAVPGAKSIDSEEGIEDAETPSRVGDLRETGFRTTDWTVPIATWNPMLLLGFRFGLGATDCGEEGMS
jgi:hypothetical protein